MATITLRYARTNEICTVNNWSLASMRIINLSRSVNAKVHFVFVAHISILDDDKLEDFRREIKQYVEERPRVWAGIVHIRHDDFDVDKERVDIKMALRHRNAWHDSGRIKRDRSNVYRLLYNLGKKLGVHFETPAEKRVVYQGGSLKCGGSDEFNARDMVKSSNIL